MHLGKSHKNYVAILLHILFLVTILVSFIVSFSSFLRLIELKGPASELLIEAKEILPLNLTLLFVAAALIIFKIILLLRNYFSHPRVRNFQLKILAAILLVAVIPLSIVGSVAYYSLASNVKERSSKEQLQTVKDSKSLAKVYLAESQKLLVSNLRSMKKYVEKNTIKILDDPSLFEKGFSGQAALLSLTEGVVFIHNNAQNTNKIISKTAFSFVPGVDNIDLVKDFKVSELGYRINFNPDDNYLRAISEIETLPNAYVMVGSLVNDVAVRTVVEMQGREQHIILQKQEQKLLKKYLTTAFFIVVTLIILTFILTSIYLISFLLRPLSRMIYASEEIIAGSYNCYIGSDSRIPEINLLISTFNHMLKKLNLDQDKQISSAKIRNNKKDSVLKDLLGKLPTAVLLLNADKEVKLHNKAAQLILDCDDIANKNISEVVSEIEPYLRAAKRKKHHVSSFTFSAEINGKIKRLHLYITLDIIEGDVKGYVLNFCDLTNK